MIGGDPPANQPPVASAGPDVTAPPPTTAPPPPSSAPPPPKVTFAAAGDHSANARTDGSLALLDASDAEFYLALGDLDYDDTPTDEAWCEYVTSRLPQKGPTFPFQLVSGNHEDDGPNGSIVNFAACLPDRLGSTPGPGSIYGAEYSFDHPATSPLVRVIMVVPGLTIEGTTYVYERGDAHYRWLSATIDEARDAGIPWVVVGMHSICYGTGHHTCSLSMDFVNLLVEKRVDLVLQGHDHNYQRSKQIALEPETCPVLPRSPYDPGCIAGDGADGTYRKGAGTVFLIAGTFGKIDPYPINPADEDFPWFARTDDTSNGIVEYVLTPDRLRARYVPSYGTFRDTFTIE